MARSSSWRPGATRTPPSHARGVRRNVRARTLAGPRFGGGVLGTAVGVALLAGAATGAVVGGPPAPLPLAAEDVRITRTGDSVSVPEQQPTVGPLRAGAGAAAGGATDPLSAFATVDRQARDDAPLPPAPALPASPAVIDPLAIDGAGLTFADRQAGLRSAEVPTSGTGELVVVPGSSPAPAPERPVRTVLVEVEAGLDVDGALFAQMVMATLNDPRGWGADGSVSFARTDGDADIRVVLASPDEVDDLCAPLETVGRYSCGRNGHAALNHTRWVQATPEFADRTQYREYLVNHEVGHLLGHPHVECSGPGEVAKIMQQQSVEVHPCVPNGWPFPGGA